MNILVIFILFIVGLILYSSHKKSERKKNELEEKLTKAEEKRRQLFEFIQSRLSAIDSFGQRCPLILRTENQGYVSYTEFSTWQKNCSPLYVEIENVAIEDIGLSTNESNIVKEFKNLYVNGESKRKQFNTEFIKRELVAYNNFFNNIENRKLDIQQRTAIITDEDNNIVIAGAGSGKTTTIVGKVSYLVDRYKIQPSQILLISFTNKSASTLSNRINIDGVEAKTFHKFGKDVIAGVEQKQPTIFDEAQYKQLITGFFKELMKDSTYLHKLTSYFTNFLKPIKPQEDFKNQGEYFQYLEDLNFTTYKLEAIPIRDRITYKREVVKSIEECKIANFLLFNGIDYEYEYPYKYDTSTHTHRQYKPDFTITNNENDVYIEHFGINKSGNVPDFFVKKDKGQTLEQATQEYKQSIEWKRILHKEHNTTLVETYSHEMFDNILFKNLSNNLAKAGVQLHPKTDDEIWKIITESAQDEIDSFINLFQVFITLMKSNNYTIATIEAKNREMQDKYQQRRNSLFIDIISPIYECYQKYLTERNEIDFSDMINKAANYVSSGKFNRKFRYIIIDEFQDISIGRYEFVKAIKNVNPGCKLFCVGDDWQSIYRFSGSDISLFKEFEKYFGHTEKSRIETTYRFYNPLISLSSNFILKNKNQIKKELKGFSTTGSTNYRIIYSVSENQDDTLALKYIFNELIFSRKAGKEVLVLGRYSFDIDRIKNEENIFDIDRKNETIHYMTKTDDGRLHRLNAQFMTVHKAKGLEADIIIVINCNSGKHGFPSGMADDHVLNLLLSKSDQFENGEERRLFYVAMTRAKEKVYFVADSRDKSKFIVELEVESGTSEVRKCPKCITADLALRRGTTNGKQWSFYGCTNFVYGCDYQEWL